MDAEPSCHYEWARHCCDGEHGERRLLEAGDTELGQAGCQLAAHLTGRALRVRPSGSGCSEAQIHRALCRLHRRRLVRAEPDHETGSARHHCEYEQVADAKPGTAGHANRPVWRVQIHRQAAKPSGLVVLADADPHVRSGERFAGLPETDVVGDHTELMLALCGFHRQEDEHRLDRPARQLVLKVRRHRERVGRRQLRDQIAHRLVERTHPPALARATEVARLERRRLRSLPLDERDAAIGSRSHRLEDAVDLPEGVTGDVPHPAVENRTPRLRDRVLLRHLSDAAEQAALRRGLAHRASMGLGPEVTLGNRGIAGRDAT